MWDCQEQGTLSLICFNYTEKNGDPLISCAPTMTWRPSVHAFLGIRACMMLLPQSQLERFPPYFWETCTSLKCRIEPDGMLQMGPTVEFFPTQWLCRGGFPLLTMVWDSRAACLQILLVEPGKHITRKPLWPLGSPYVVFCRKCLYLVQKEVLLFWIKCFCHLLKIGKTAHSQLLKNRDRNSAEPCSC